MSKESLIELEQRKEAEALLSYDRLKKTWDAMLQQEESAVNEWLVEAEKLVDMFRETRNLFGSKGVRTILSSFFPDREGLTTNPRRHYRFAE